MHVRRIANPLTDDGSVVAYTMLASMLRAHQKIQGVLGLHKLRIALLYNILRVLLGMIPPLD